MIHSETRGAILGAPLGLFLLSRANRIRDL